MMILNRVLADPRLVNFRRAILAAAAFFFAGALGSGVAAQSVSPVPAPAAAPAAMPASPATPIAVSAAGAAPTPAKPAAAQDNANATKASKKKKVFTDDDVSALRAKSRLANDDAPDSAMIYGAVGACDAECEEEVKAKIGAAPEEEGEWKLQLTAARREIGEDHAWRELYAKGQQTMRTVCGLRAQIENARMPSGGDYQSRLERAKQQKMFEDEAAMMNQQMANGVAAMNQLIAQFSEREPVRAGIMAVIGERLFNGDCPDDGGK
jgi:hypothetical protein